MSSPSANQRAPTGMYRPPGARGITYRTAQVVTAFSSFSSKRSTRMDSLSKATPLELVVPRLAQIELFITSCASCGVRPNAHPKSFISLVPCNHLLCSDCVNSLVNASSNVPPRAGSCFACEGGIENFLSVRFVPEVKWEGKAEVPETPRRFIGGTNQGRLSPLRNLDWSEELSTPGTTPDSSARPSLSLYGSKAYEQHYPVVRIDNVPWDLTIAQVRHWIPEHLSIPSSARPLSIHILCNRAMGKTLNQFYVEFPSLEAAQELVRNKKGAHLLTRIVSVNLSTRAELMSQIFPIVEDQARAKEGEPVINAEDLEGLADLCRLAIPQAIKAPERPFLNIVSILLFLPKMEHDKLREQLFALVEVALVCLIENEHRFNQHLPSSWENVVKIFSTACLECPVFFSSQKSHLVSLLNDIRIAPLSGMVDLLSLHQHPLRSLTFDRVRSTQDSLSDADCARAQDSDRSPPSPSPNRRSPLSLHRDEPLVPLVYRS